MVFDINIFVSALITRGKPKKLWLKAVRKEFNLITSREILSEFVEVLRRKKFQRYIEEQDIRDFLEVLNVTARFVHVKSRFRVVKQDPDDDIVLRTAYDGKADYIISGDEHLLRLGEFRGIRILSVDKALRTIKK
ncbi:MAG: putative toxin-antitoxin system toxin component, PIN family [Candidatus Brockarchaeota archaeon]|nr:putative toxin-antitoxin system toxin component, PIN family [Candidatus Brockarchaeota archaeon]MBO3842622.1 putative toxin-antitoxin system toxin component, PIN family [Candidatus Brockarchaeota archaeon]